MDCDEMGELVNSENYSEVLRGWIKEIFAHVACSVTTLSLWATKAGLDLAFEHPSYDCQNRRAKL